MSAKSAETFSITASSLVQRCVPGSLTPFHAEHAKGLLADAVAGIRPLEIDSLVALGVEEEVLVLVIALTAAFDQVHVRSAILARAIDLRRSQYVEQVRL